MSRDSLVSVRDLHRSYGELRAVQGISFDVARGEVLGFLGPNGAGKTTTMQMICGALAPSAGRITIGGADLLESPIEAKRHVGYLPEQPPLYRELTVDEYLDHCARIRKMPGHERRAAREEAKGRTGLADAGRRVIGNLSKGYQQRLGIAQAILHGPDVVVLDEPTDGLDPIPIREIRGLIRELGTDHGVVVSTHILPEAQAVCDRVQILDEGRIVLDERLDALAGNAQTGSVRVVFARPPGAAALESIPGVIDVEDHGDGTFGLRFEPGASVDPVVRASVEGEWGMRELTPQSRSLEDVFVSLMAGDRGAAAGET